MADVFAYLYGFGAGGDFTKSVIIVTAPTGSTVTCTKGTTVKTATEKNGEWWFKNLDIGTWTLKATLSGQTATQTVNITQFDVYRIAMAYFKAYIVVTYPSGSTCTCSKDGKTLTAPNTSGSYTFTVDSTGTWTVKATDGARTVSESVSITASGQSKNVALSYEIIYISGGVLQTLYKTTTDSDGSLTLASNDGLLKIVGTDWGSHRLYFDPVDFSKYNTLSFSGKGFYDDPNYDHYEKICVGVYRSLSDFENGATNAIAYVTMIRKDSGSIDLSSVSGTGYVAVLTVNRADIYISNLKLY